MLLMPRYLMKLKIFKINPVFILIYNIDTGRIFLIIKKRIYIRRVRPSIIPMIAPRMRSIMRVIIMQKQPLRVNLGL
jgi:hypothetical protein